MALTGQEPISAENLYAILGPGGGLFASNEDALNYIGNKETASVAAVGSGTTITENSSSYGQGTCSLDFTLTTSAGIFDRNKYTEVAKVSPSAACPTSNAYLSRVATIRKSSGPSLTYQGDISIGTGGTISVTMSDDGSVIYQGQSCTVTIRCTYAIAGSSTSGASGAEAVTLEQLRQILAAR